MSFSLPPRPNYEQLRKQAKDLYKACQAGDIAAAERLHTHHPNFSGTATLAEAQLAVARQHGFGSWPRLKRAVEDIAAVEAEIKALRVDFAAVDESGRQRLLKAVHDRRRFVDYQEGDAELSDADARLLVANRQDYALWSKYDSYVLLDPAVKDVITAVRQGDLDGLRKVLQEAPEAANPRWVGGYQARESDQHPDIPNDSIPLFCVCEGVFRGTNKKGNEGELARALLEAGADPDLCWKPMEGAVSFNCPQVLKALIEHDANIEGPAPGVFMAYPMLFGFTEVCQLLAEAGAQLDLRFAAGLGRTDEMARWVDEGVLRPDPGLADPYMQNQAVRGEFAVRVERSDEVVLGQALLYACLHDRPAAAQWLLERGADVNALVRGTDHDATVLHRMATYNHGETASPSDIERQRAAMVDWLLERGADPTLPDPVHGANAMQWAVHANMIHDMARRLVVAVPAERFAAAADDGENDRLLRHLRGEEVVHSGDIQATLAFYRRNPDSGGVLLRRTGFNADSDGQLAAALIDAGVDPKGVAGDAVNRRLVGAESHLHTACSFNNTGVSEVLLKAGADPNRAGGGDLFHGGTPLGYATFFGFPRLVDLLLEYGATPYNLAMAAATGELMSVQGYFLPDGSLRNDAGGTSILDQVPDEPTFDDAQTVVQKAFQVAVLHGRLEVVRFLLDKGVDVNGKIGVEYHGGEWAYLNQPEWARFDKDPNFGEIWGTVLKHAEARQYKEIAVLLRQRGGRLE
ncbi:MAG: hypothetical protein GKR89_32135 [Candidatus Latescibacteria bacterium]|nr:hypothetical protein [Candidatus Latescibacterota bacterium]